MHIQSKYIPIIKVIGVGGAGSKAIEKMCLLPDFKQIEFIAVKPKPKGLEEENRVKTIFLCEDDHGDFQGESHKKWQSIAESRENVIQATIGKADIIFIYCEEGRGFSTGVSPVIADTARTYGALTIAICTEPFIIEGRLRRDIAKRGIEELKKHADLLILVSKQKIFDQHKKGTPIREEFAKLKNPLHDGVRIISNIIQATQMINIDLADLKLIIKNSGYGFIGEGEGIGAQSERGKQAVEKAVSVSLTNNTLTDVDSALIHIVGGSDLAMNEVNEVCSYVKSSMKDVRNLKFGLTIDDKKQGVIQVTIIGASSGNQKKFTESLKRELMLSGTISDLDIPAFIRKRA